MGVQDKVRLLFLRKRGEFGYGPPLTMFRFQKAVEKRVEECRWAGDGWPLHKNGESLDETVKRVYGNDPPDWAIDRERADPLNPRRDYKAGAYVSDLHARMGLGIKNPHKLRKLLRKLGYDALFLKSKYIYGTDCPADFFLRKPTSKIYFLPYAVDAIKFRPRKKKRHDVLLIGSMSARYPIRVSLLKYLPEYCKRKGLRLRIQRRTPRYWQALEAEKKPDYLVRSSYEDALGRTRFLPFDSSIYRYPVIKYFEGMAAGCVVMADEPSSADELGFINGVNYVKINKGDWVLKMDYYLKHPEEADEIAKNARELILKRHTITVRSKEFVRMLEECPRLT